MVSPNALGFRADDPTMLGLFALGLRDREVAHCMGLTLATIRGRLERLRLHSKTHSMAQLIYWALDREIIEPVPLWRPLELSEEVLDILWWISRGLTLVQVGNKVGFSEDGVSYRLSAAMKKNEAFTRHHLVAMWYSEDCYRQEDLNNLKVWGSTETTELRGSG